MSGMYSEISALLTEHLGVPAEEIHPASTFSDLEVDSLALVELGIIIEDRFGVTPEIEERNLTLGQFCDKLDAVATEAKAATS